MKQGFGNPQQVGIRNIVLPIFSNLELLGSVDEETIPQRRTPKKNMRTQRHQRNAHVLTNVHLQHSTARNAVPISMLYITEIETAGAFVHKDFRMCKA